MRYATLFFFVLAVLILLFFVFTSITAIVQHAEAQAAPKSVSSVHRPTQCAPFYELEDNEAWFDCMGVGYE